MSRHIGWASAAFACWAMTIGLAAAQDLPRAPRDDRRAVPVQPAPAPAPAAAQPVPAPDSRQPMTHRVSAVLGSKVSIQGGLTIGTVSDIVFDDDGYIDYLVVHNDGKYVPVPWQAARFNFEERAATVNISQQQFQQVPAFTGQSWPTFDYGYAQRIYGVYGLTPHQRRVERREDRRDR